MDCFDFLLEISDPGLEQVNPMDILGEDATSNTSKTFNEWACISTCGAVVVVLKSNLYKYLFPNMVLQIELHSLEPNKIPYMALTATATRQTKETITCPLLWKFVEVSESPNKATVCYSAQTMDKRNPLIQYFQWVLNELKEKRDGTERTIILRKKWMTQYLPMTAKILENV